MTSLRVRGTRVADTVPVVRGQHGVTWSGDLPVEPDDAWCERIREDSELCARITVPVEVATAGAVLRCTPRAVNLTE